MMRDLFIGLDPGAQGYIAAVDADGRLEMLAFGHKGTEDHDVARWLRQRRGRIRFAVLERTWSGHAGGGKLMASHGFLRGLLVALRIPFEVHTPSKWQGALRCRSKGSNHVLRARAQELFPEHDKISLHAAAAALIAEYARRIHYQRTGAT